MIINAIDLGPDIANLANAPLQTNNGSQLGQTAGTTLVYGARTLVWATGSQEAVRTETVYVEAPNPIGGVASSSPAALRILVRQLQELADNSPANPVYIQWRSGNGVLAVDPDDGWWILKNVKPDMNTEGAGWAAVEVTASRVGPLAPASVALSYPGGALSSSYSATAAPLLSYPVGASGQPATTGSRTGGEGAIPISTLPATDAIDPAPFVPPPTIAALFTGGCRAWDTLNTGTNPVPVAGGTYVHANWVEILGTQHDVVGDLVITNGLLLLLYAVGQPGAPRVWLWNTSLGTPTWQLIGDVEYQDNAGNTGALRSYDLDRLGLQEVRIRCRLNTSAGNWARLHQKLQAGRYECYDEWYPLSQANTSTFARRWISTAVYATGFTDATSSTTFPSNLATTTVSGYAAAQGSASGSPIFGWLYQNTPTTAQGRLSTTTGFELGDTGGPAHGAMLRYGFFAVPYSGAVVLATARGIVAPLFAEWVYDRTVMWARGT